MQRPIIGLKEKKTKKKQKTTKNELAIIKRDFASTVLNAFKPTPSMSSLEFVEKYRRLSSAESATQGPYSSAPTPFVRAWHDALDSSYVSQVTIVAPAQTGKTTFLQNVLMSQIALHPQPAMFMFPTLEMAKIFSRGRLRAVFNNKVMKGLINKKNHATVNMNQISFKGGSLILCGSNNIAALSSHPIATLYADEIDRLTSDSAEGQPLELAKARTRSFFSRKILLTSTPTSVKGSQIYKEFLNGTQEHYCYRCQDCGSYTEPSFERLAEYKYDEQHKTVLDEELFMGCRNCGSLISETDFRKILMSGEFAWIPDAPNVVDHRSFWLSGFVSPFVPWKEIIVKYEQAKNDPNKLRVFKNTVLAELYDGLEIDKDKAGSLLKSRVDFGPGVEVPTEVTHLVAGVDTQDQYLRYVVYGFGKDIGLCCIESGRIDGVPSDAETYNRFRTFLARQWKKADNTLINLDLVFVDSQGHYAGTWYKYAYDLRRNINPRVHIVKGASVDDAPAIKQPPTLVQIGDKTNKKAELYIVGVSALKMRLYHLIDAEAIQFNAAGNAGIDQNFFDELLSETTTIYKGKIKWVKIHKRNEALDCSVYSLAALEYLNIIPTTKKVVREKKQEKENNTEPQMQPELKTKKRRIIGRNFDGGGWGGGYGW